MCSVPRRASRKASQAVRHPRCASVHYTAVEEDFPSDAVLSEDFSTTLERDFEVVSEGDRIVENDVGYRILMYKRRR